MPVLRRKEKGRDDNIRVDLGFGVVMVRRVPAQVCSQCGADWITDDIAARLETVIDGARKRHRQVEVTTFA